MNKTKCYKLHQINKPNDLEKVQLEWVLNEYDFNDIKGLYFDVPYSKQEIDLSKYKPVKVSVGVIVHNRLFTKEVNVYEDKSGVWITVDKFHELF